MKNNLNSALDAFLFGYLTAALFTTNDESNDSGGSPLDDKYTVRDICQETVDKSREACAKFQKENADNLQEYYRTINCKESSLAAPEREAGIDFWMSRTGQGTGYFDADGVPDETQEALQEAARKTGNVDFYIGDDGEIYVTP